MGVLMKFNMIFTELSTDQSVKPLWNHSWVHQVIPYVSAIQLDTVNSIYVQLLTA